MPRRKKATDRPTDKATDKQTEADKPRVLFPPHPHQGIVTTVSPAITHDGCPHGHEFKHMRSRQHIKPTDKKSTHITDKAQITLIDLMFCKRCLLMVEVLTLDHIVNIVAMRSTGEIITQENETIQ